jgi:hypothetical protein
MYTAVPQVARQIAGLLEAAVTLITLVGVEQLGTPRVLTILRGQFLLGTNIHFLSQLYAPT